MSTAARQRVALVNLSKAILRLTIPQTRHGKACDVCGLQLVRLCSPMGSGVAEDSALGKQAQELLRLCALVAMAAPAAKADVLSRLRQYAKALAGGAVGAFVETAA